MPTEHQMILRTPGPTPVPDRIQKAMSQPMVGHRSSTFGDLFSKTADRLKPVFGTSGSCYIVSGSGTSALEMAVVNAFHPGEEVVVVVTGNFGERFVDICQAYQLKVHRLDIEWGLACEPDQLQTFLEDKKAVQGVFLTHCETSTGVLNPIKELADVIQQETDALIIVDAVSSAGAVPIEMDDFGLDVVVTGSQKAFMLPPGLAFISASKRAWEKIDHTPVRGFYLDLKKYRSSLEFGNTPFTPAISLIYGLEEACKMIEEEGLKKVFKRHETLMKMTRAALRKLSCPLLASDANASPTVTAISKAEKIDPEQIRSWAKSKYNLVMAGGQKKLKGQIFRIGHMGACTPSELLETLTLLEQTFIDGGHSITLGASVKKAEEVLQNELQDSRQ